MIEKLKFLGFSELEAKCYLSLIEKDDQTGYEIAKNISASRSNVYNALTSLCKKGACLMREDKTATYSAVSIDEIIDNFKVEFKQTATELKKSLKRKTKENHNFYNIQGLEAIKAVLKKNIAHSKKSVYADLNFEDVKIFLPLLELAQNNGLDVTLITSNLIESTLKNVIIDNESDYKKDKINDFTFLFDSVKSVVGSIDDNIYASALITKHPAIVSKVESGFYHDYLVSTLNNDFKKEFIEKYGDNFEMIKKKFKKLIR